MRRNYRLEGGDMSAVHFGPTDQPLRLVFCHANGFNGYAYKSILEPLGVHCAALDLRGHGQSTLPFDAGAIRSFWPFARDIAQFLSDYSEAPVLVAGHSMGAVSAILAASLRPEKFSGYVGFDPVSMPWLGRVMPLIPGGRAYIKTRFSLAKKAGARRSAFESHEAAFERYKGRGTFKNISDEALHNYLTGGLTPLAGGGMTLSCAPQWEQAVYAAQAHNLYKAARCLPGNSRIYYAGKFGPSTPGTRAKIARIIGQDKMEFHKDLAHFFPLENEAFAIAALQKGLLG